MDHAVELEAWCLYHELEKAISALFELPGIPIPDGTILRAVDAVRRGCEVVGTSRPMHFRAKYDRDEGTLLIFQVLHGNRSPRTIARRNNVGAIEFLEPLWGIRGLPAMA